MNIRIRPSSLRISTYFIIIIFVEHDLRGISVCRRVGVVGRWIDWWSDDRWSDDWWSHDLLLAIESVDDWRANNRWTVDGLRVINWNGINDWRSDYRWSNRLEYWLGINHWRSDDGWPNHWRSNDRRPYDGRSYNCRAKDWLQTGWINVERASNR